MAKSTALWLNTVLNAELRTMMMQSTA